ncbi:MAG: DUF1579 domain-containing protein [Caldilineae bacterium]|nr:DUF1579 domain-containing protein [Anaerolineae bacterium]MCB0205496.1 DUF1579 domain-containing protein [Anaerolineae bacterium]MCB0254349.1 DUF1579 domain-containing protein [Anaerolineae bacterium]MCB9152600.1 DUF1579 domain-containing protein [Caldilineae bacterium]
MSQQTNDISNLSIVHSGLARICGQWQGVTRTWFEPGQLADESPQRGAIRPVLGGYFVVHEYEGTLQGQPMRGIAIYGFDIATGKCQAAWIDNVHMGTAIMCSQAEPDERAFVVLGGYDDPNGGPPWGWRTEIDLTDDDHITITAYNIPPGGEAYKAVETRYERVR